MAWPYGEHTDLGELISPFRLEAERLLARVKELNLPLRVQETYRTPARQTALRAAGKSQLSGDAAPHPRRCALDLILDEDAAPPAFRSRGPWWTGVEKDSLGVRRVVVDEVTLAVWLALEQLVLTEFPRLECGASWRSSSSDILGWDAYHIQLRAWRSHPFSPQKPSGDAGSVDPSPPTGAAILALIVLSSNL